MTRCNALPFDSSAPDPRLASAVRTACFFGVALVMLLPAARAFSPTFGWMPLWLVVAPALAWWSLHRFPLPGARGQTVQAQRRGSRRRAGVTARRRSGGSPQRMPRAA